MRAIAFIAVFALGFLPAPALAATAASAAQLTAPVFEITSSASAPAALDPSLDVEGWPFTGAVSYHTYTQGASLSELDFPTSGTMPIVRLTWHPIMLRYGSTSLNADTSTDTDFGDIFGFPGVLYNQTHQSQSGTANFFTGDVLLNRKGSNPRFYVGYESHSYNFTWTGPVTCSIPFCFLNNVPGGVVIVPGTGPVLTYGITYGGPHIGVTGDWRSSSDPRLSLSVDLAYGFITVNAVDFHILRSLTFTQSGTGSSVLGEVAIGYSVSPDLTVHAGYQLLSITTSGSQTCTPGGCGTPSGLETVNTTATNQGLTAGVLWNF